MNSKKTKWKHTITRLLAFGLPLLTLIACGGATTEPVAPESASPQTAPSDTEAAPAPDEGAAASDANKFDLQAMLSREFAPLSTAEIKDPQENWQAVVETNGNPQVSASEEGLTMVSVPVGTEAAIDCIIYNEPVDIGATIGKMFEAGGQTAQFHQIAPTNVGAAGSYPMLAVSGLYTVEQNGQKAAGLYKMAILAHKSRSVLCTHDELGYSQAFVRVVKGLFSSLSFKNGPQEPQYAEIWTVSLSGVPMGFSSLTVHVAADGTRTIEDQTTMVIPRTPQQLHTSDRYSKTQSDKKGQITKQTNVNMEGAEIDLNLEIERTKKKKYTYKGSMKGKSLEGNFAASKKDGLPDSVDTMVRVKKLFKKGKDASFPIPGYLPDIAPDKTTEVKYEVFGTKSPKSFANHIGELTITGTANETDDINQISMPMGALEMKMERVYSRGDVLEL